MKTLPIVDPSDTDAGARIDAACRSVGFFAVPLDAPLRARRDELIALATEFFALPEPEKAQVSMAVGGTAWRGWPGNVTTRPSRGGSFQEKTAPWGSGAGPGAATGA
ncbi:MAG: 2-oxoglutarate and iron-dependent oxygenase domain-containing protein [Hylemonella sp.]